MFATKSLFILKSVWNVSQIRRKKGNGGRFNKYRIMACDTTQIICCILSGEPNILSNVTRNCPCGCGMEIWFVIPSPIQPNLILEIIKNMFSIISGSQVIIDIYRPVDVDIIIIKTKSLLSTGESPWFRINNNPNVKLTTSRQSKMFFQGLFINLT